MLERQQKTARYMLLATVIASVVNMILLVVQADIYIPYCAAVPYYLTFLGHYFDGYTFSTYTTTGMVMAFVSLAVWLVTWWMAGSSRGWMRFGQILTILDTVFLAIFAFVFLSDPASCLLEGLLHIVVIYELHVGLKAGKRMAQLKQQPPVDFPPETDWDTETPTAVEYSSDLDS